MAVQVRLTSAVQGARHIPITVDWGINLTGATITGTKKELGTDTVTVLDGTFVISSPATAGVFVWTLGAGDVGTAGRFLVQFKATFTQYDRTVESNWIVYANQGAGVVPAEMLVGVTESQAAFLDTVNVDSPTDGQVLTWNAPPGEWTNEDAAGGGGGVDTFLELTDTPAAYTGAALEMVRVNAAGDGLEFNDHASLPADSITLGHVRLGNGLETDGNGLLSTFPAQQPFSDELTAIDDLAFTDGNIIVGNGTTWVAESGATARTSLGAAAAADLTSHTGNTSNPHSVTAAQTGALTQAAADALYEPLGGGGATTFLGLTDTPADYAGHALKALRVNAGETAVEFVTLGTLSTQSGTFSGGGTLATGGFTLTVPATGTAALRGVANIFTQLNTFTAAATNIGAVTVTGGSSLGVSASSAEIGMGNNSSIRGIIAYDADQGRLILKNIYESGPIVLIPNNGGTGSAVPTVYVGSGVFSGTPPDAVVRSTSASGTNIAGGDLFLAGGNSTGTGAAGNLEFQTSPAGSSGSSQNALVTAGKFDGQATGGDETRLLLLDLSDGTLKRVTCGADDSGGAGHKVLRIAN